MVPPNGTETKSDAGAQLQTSHPTVSKPFLYSSTAVQRRNGQKHKKTFSPPVQGMLGMLLVTDEGEDC